MLHIALLLLRHSLHLPNVMLPNLLSRLRLQILIPNTHVYPALERLVEGLDAVRRQEQDALVVLCQTQEDRDERVAMDIVRLARLEEDVGFVEKQDGAP